MKHETVTEKEEERRRRRVGWVRPENLGHPWENGQGESMDQAAQQPLPGCL